MPSKKETEKALDPSSVPPKDETINLDPPPVDDAPVLNPPIEDPPESTRIPGHLYPGDDGYQRVINDFNRNGRPRVWGNYMRTETDGVIVFIPIPPKTAEDAYAKSAFSPNKG